MDQDVRNANWKDRLLYCLGKRKAFLIEGDSMQPSLQGGDAVLVDPKSMIQAGDIVLAAHPYKSSVKILKRVAEIRSDGNLVLLGDNPAESTDSRAFGSVSIESILGRVDCKLK